MSMINLSGVKSRTTEDRDLDWDENSVLTDEFDKRYSSGSSGSSEEIESKSYGLAARKTRFAGSGVDEQITSNESSVMTEENQKRYSSGSSEEIQSKSPGSVADKSRLSRSKDEELYELFLGKPSGPPKKLNNLTWVDGTQYRTSLTYEELVEYRKEMDELMAHPPGWNDPNTYKKQSAELCHQCFPIIQKQFPQMADCELVEPMHGHVFMSYSGFAHLNFKAKHKYAEESCGSVYFAEFDIRREEVTCFSEIHIDPSFGTDCYEHCGYCHPDPLPPYIGYVYHPNNNGTSTWSSGY